MKSGKFCIDKFIIIIIIFLTGFFLQRKYFDEFPSHVHAWAQSDRYALAIGFVKNNFDFFHPRTFVLNHQFPGSFMHPSVSAVTSVDFPVHDYMAALIMKLFNTRSPWCFRVYIFLYSLTGLFFLFKIGNFIFANIYKSVILVTFAATSPVFAYYQAGFLPTIPSLSNGFIGIYLYLMYLKKRRISSFYFSLLFLTLSALSRTPFTIVLLSVVILEFYSFLKSKKTEVRKIMAFIVSFIALGGYYFYNLHLRAKFGSMFLDHIMPPSGLKEMNEIIATVLQKWFFQYFSGIHYFIFILFLVISIILFYFKKKPALSYLQGKLLFLTTVIISGCMIYSFLMLRQFNDHDYYFLDTFYIPFILCFTLLLSLVPFPVKRVQILIFILIFFPAMLFFIINARSELENRRKLNINDPTGETIKNFSHSKEFLDSLKIPESARILDLCSFAPDVPFILMDREGFTTMTTSNENIRSMLKWNYDYIVIQDEYFLSEIYTNYPEIINNLTRIGDNGKISVYQYSSHGVQVSISDFLHHGEKTPVYSKEINFDAMPDKEWGSFKITSDVSHSGRFSALLNNDDEYGITLKINNMKELINRINILNISAFIFEPGNNVKDCLLVTSVKTRDGIISYKATDLSRQVKSSGKWEKFDLYNMLPPINSIDFEIDIYIWNKGHNRIYYDDFSVRII